MIRYLRVTDPVVFFFWVLATTFPTPWAAPLRYMLAAYVVGCLVIFARTTLSTLPRSWPAFILPMLAIISMMWAPSSGDAMRKGLTLCLASLICVYVASRLSARQIVTIYFAGESVAALLSAINPTVINGDWTGVFGQKNFLAVHMFVLYVMGLALMLDSTTHRLLRLATLIMVPLAGTLIILTHSATTLLLIIGATGALVVHAYVWQPASRVRYLRTIILLIIALLGLLASLLLFGLLQFDAVDSVLAALGKDSTLTGRTFIWGIGRRVMEEHPWTGVGANGFWRPELGAAQEITRYFHYDGFTKFSFHNSYIENGVQFGYPGYYGSIFIGCWALFSVSRTWLKNQNLLNAAFLILAAMILFRSNAEIDLASEFGATIMLLYIGSMRRDPKPPPVAAAPTPGSPAAPLHGPHRR
jgi:exopolysaccharide production protein ExoQ